MGSRGCPFCGKTISDMARECPFCHEYVPEIRRNEPSTAVQGKSVVRRGLWYMLVLAILYFVFSGQTPLRITIPYQSLFTDDVLPVLFFVALGFVVYGVYLRVK
ncbi:MAG TPA: hypothetical protein VGT03_15990 [Candidatus Acidoferrales bacterium]|nr:hypothetical protein [Candidatus Acidoferrales bacterium]